MTISLTEFDKLLGEAKPFDPDDLNLDEFDDLLKKARPIKDEVPDLREFDSLLEKAVPFEPDAAPQTFVGVEVPDPPRPEDTPDQLKIRRQNAIHDIKYSSAMIKAQSRMGEAGRSVPALPPLLADEETEESRQALNRQEIETTRLDIYNEELKKEGFPPLDQAPPPLTADDIEFFTRNSIPWYGPGASAIDLWNLYDVMERMKKGTETVADLEKWGHFQTQISRGYQEKTRGANIKNLLADALPFALEIGGSGFVAGGVRGGLKAGQRALFNKFSKEVEKAAIQSQITKVTVGSGVKSAGKEAGRIAADAAARMSAFVTRIGEGTAQNVLGQASATPGKGDEPYDWVVAKEGQSLGEAVKNATFDTYVEVASEMTGHVFAGIGKFVKKSLGIKPVRVGVDSFLRMFGFSGAVGEVLEEDVGAALRGLGNLTGQFDVDNHVLSLGERLDAFLAFSIPGGGAHMASFVINRHLEAQQMADSIDPNAEEGQPGYYPSRGALFNEVIGAKNTKEQRRRAALTAKVGLQMVAEDLAASQGSRAGPSQQIDQSPSDLLGGGETLGEQRYTPNLEQPQTLGEQRYSPVITERQDADVPEIPVIGQPGPELGINKLEGEPDAQQQREDEGPIPQGGGDFSVEFDARGGAFLGGLTETKRTHKYGAAVDIKEDEFYSNPDTKLYLSEDATAGAAVSADGDMVSVFKVPGSTANSSAIIAQASENAVTLDAYDINGVLPSIYGSHGWRPAARIKFNPEYAPDGWDTNVLGKPDVVLMVRDTEGVSGLQAVPSKAEGGYESIRDSVPVFEDYDDAVVAQQEAVSKVPLPKGLKKKAKAKSATHPNDLPPLQKGFVRIFHGTQSANLGTKIKEGLKTGKNLGSTKEDAPVVFGFTKPHRKFGGNMVVADVPASDAEVDAGSGEVRVLRDIQPNEIIGSFPKPKPPKVGDRVSFDGIDGKQESGTVSKVTGENPSEVLVDVDGGGTGLIAIDRLDLALQEKSIRQTGIEPPAAVPARTAAETPSGPTGREARLQAKESLKASLEEMAKHFVVDANAPKSIGAILSPSKELIDATKKAVVDTVRAGVISLDEFQRSARETFGDAAFKVVKPLIESAWSVALKEVGPREMRATMTDTPIDTEGGSLVEKAVAASRSRRRTSNEIAFFNAWTDLVRRTGEQIKPFTKGGRVSKAAVRKVLAKMINDTGAFRKKNDLFGDYYDTDIDIAREAAITLFPELRNDSLWALYLLHNGIASSNTRLPDNTSEVVEVWDYIRNNSDAYMSGDLGIKFGVKPSTGNAIIESKPFQLWGGSVMVNKARHHTVVAQSLAEMGGDVGKLMAFWLGSVPMKEINSLRKKYGFKTGVKVGVTRSIVAAATGQDQMIPRSFFFGPKVGAYIRNLQGDHRFTTIDVWEARLLRGYFKGLFFKVDPTEGTPKEVKARASKAFGIPDNEEETKLVLAVAAEYNKLLNLAPSAGQAVRWFYTIDRIGKAGYSKAVTSGTISTYTEAAIASRANAPGREEARDKSFGVDRPGEDAKSGRAREGSGGSGKTGAEQLREAQEEFNVDPLGVLPKDKDPRRSRTKLQDALEEWKKQAVLASSGGALGSQLGNIGGLAKASKDVVLEALRSGAQTFADVFNLAVEAVGQKTADLLKVTLQAEWDRINPPDESYTSIQNAVVDKERAKRGLPPAMSAASRDFDTVWDEAMQIVERDSESETDPNFTLNQLIADIDAGKKAATDVDDAILLHRQITLQNEFDKLKNKVDKAEKEGDVEELARLHAEQDTNLIALERIYDINKKAGTASGRGLNARKMLATHDFSIAKMLADTRSAIQTDKLSTIDQAETLETHRNIQNLEKQLEASEERLVREESGKVIEGIAKEEKKSVKKRARKQDVKVAKAKVEEAWKGLEDLLGTTFSANAFFNADVYAGAAKLAKAYVDLGVANVTDFMAEVTDRVGKKVAGEMDDVFRRAWSDAHHEATKPTPPKKSETPEAVGRYAHKLARWFVGDGITDIDELIDVVHAELVETFPDMTRLDAMNAISGYGRFKPLNQEEVAVILRDLKGQMQQLGKIADLEAGQAPSKSGVEQRVPSGEERRLIQKVNQLIKRGGFDITDPGKQQKSALSAVKTRLRNQIADLSKQIEDKKKTVTERFKVDTDDEVEALTMWRDELREDFRRIFGEAKVSDERRTQNAIAATKRSIAELERRIRERDVRPAKRGTKTKVNAELTALRARRDELKEEFRELQDSINPKMSPRERQINAIRRRLQGLIADYEQRIATDDFAPRTRKVLTYDKETEDIRFQLEKVKTKYHRRLLEHKKANRSTARKIGDTAVEAINASRAILTSADLSAIGRQGGILVASHPILGARATNAMIRSAKSKAGASRAADEILRRDNAPLYKRAGLAITDPFGPLAQQEEVYMSRWSKVIPIVAASERAYVAYLNQLRADTFDAFSATLGKDGTITEEEAKVIANYINVATGRGTIFGFERAATAMATVFFAPRFVTSRFQWILGGLTLKPLWARDPGYTRRVRAMIAKEYARSLTGLGLMYGMSAAALYAYYGAGGEDKEWDIESNPLSSDFGKIRIRNTRIDPLSGVSQAMVFTSKFLSSHRKQLSTGKIILDWGESSNPFQQDSVKVLGRFIRFKLSPAFGLALTLKSGQTAFGEQVTAKEAIQDLIRPISTREIENHYKEFGLTGAVGLALLEFIGISTQFHDQSRIDTRPLDDKMKSLTSRPSKSRNETIRDKKNALAIYISRNRLTRAQANNALRQGYDEKRKVVNGKLTPYGISSRRMSHYWPRKD